MVRDAVCVAARDGAVVRVIWVNGVEGGIVVAEDDIAFCAVAVRDDEVGDSRGIGDEFGFDARG